jgi:outer membrane protein OmpA-like peptidoglycan-associated protein
MNMEANRSGLGRPWPLALLALLAVAPAWSQDSLSIKELLDRAQTKPQTEAVEELIRKLKGDREPEKMPEHPAPLAAPKAEPPDVGKSAPSVALPPAKANLTPRPEERQSELTKTPEAPTEALPKADIAQGLPSVDLEVHFDYKSARITPQAVDLLTALGRALSDERLAGQTFLITGHTDAKGGPTYNLRLSQARAEAVREFLIKSFGVGRGRLRAEGHGLRQLRNASMPFAAENRRVQVTNITQ